MRLPVSERNCPLEARSCAVSRLCDAQRMLPRRLLIALLGAFAALVLAAVDFFGGLVIAFGACNTDDGYPDAKEHNFMCNDSTGGSLYGLAMLLLPPLLVLASTVLAVRWVRVRPIAVGASSALALAALVFTVGYAMANA